MPAVEVDLYPEDRVAISVLSVRERLGGLHDLADFPILDGVYRIDKPPNLAPVCQIELLDRHRLWLLSGLLFLPLISAFRRDLPVCGHIIKFN